MVFVRRHSWWVVPTIVVATVVAFGFVGGVPLLVYAIANAAGTWLRVDGPDIGPRSKGAWLCWATIALLPVGVLAALGTRSALGPSDRAMTGSTEDIVAGRAQRISQPGAGGPAGRTGLG